MLFGWSEIVYVKKINLITYIYNYVAPKSKCILSKQRRGA